MKVTPDGTPLSLLARAWDALVLKLPVFPLLLCLGLVGYFGYYAKDFKLDASSEAIVLEKDKDLRYYRYSRQVFGSDDYVIAMVTPEGDLFAPDTLKKLKALHDDLATMENVDSVTSIINVPLFHSPKVPLLQVADGYRTLESEDVDIEAAREELVNSPLYRDHLISSNGETTAVQVIFKDTDPDYTRITNRRADLKDKRDDDGLTAEESAELGELESQFREKNAEYTEARGKDIQEIRAIMARHEGLGDLHLGGVPMVMADIIDYVENDLEIFGVGVLAFVLLMLAIFFRKLRWVILPTLTCLLTVVIMVGYLGWVEWRVTIVSSNFISLLLIITMAMAVHIVVRYREYYAGNPLLSNRELLLLAVNYTAKPCLYTTLTTMVGFASLYVSQIRPVMDFGFMMTMGLAVAYFMCFVFFPAILRFTTKGSVPPPELAELSNSPVAIFARFTEKRGIFVLLGSVFLFVVCIIGARRLEVENRFIDYFKESTPIYQGMTVIDERLGGTTPLEVVLEGEGENYWLEPENLDRMRAVHDWLDSLPETGKVISPVTMVRMLEGIAAPMKVNKQIILMAKNSIPEEISREVLKPYTSPDLDKVRFAMRVRESDRGLDRKALIAKIENYFEENPGPEAEEHHVTGVFVLYNNMLQSLFTSQIETIAAVFLAIWIMFVVLFRSLRLATIAIIPNILPVVLVLGALGWLNIPLDIMTIMIAAITLGIAVDFAIHYIHRFQVEFKREGNYVRAMYRCHNSIGRAIWYTSVTIIVGFSILMVSNFIPTIYFGFFTGIAIIVALLASVTLLPYLLITLKPLGPERGAK